MKTGVTMMLTVDPHVGIRTLGVRITPAGNWNDEHVFRRSQSWVMSLRFAGSAMPKETARTGCFSMVCPTLEFPLAAMQFTQAQCNKMQASMLGVCLLKMGCNRNMDKRVVFGPQPMGGISMHDLRMRALRGSAEQLDGSSRLKNSRLIFQRCCTVTKGFMWCNAITVFATSLSDDIAISPTEATVLFHQQGGHLAICGAVPPTI